MTYNQRIARVNRAFNFWADTTGVDYVTGALSAVEVMQEDRDNQELVSTFPELRRLGY